jgi:hypothetical protein
MWLTGDLRDRLMETHGCHEPAQAPHGDMWLTGDLRDRLMETHGCHEPAQGASWRHVADGHPPRTTSTETQAIVGGTAPYTATRLTSIGRSSLFPWDVAVLALCGPVVYLRLPETAHRRRG